MHSEKVLEWSVASRRVPEHGFFVGCALKSGPSDLERLSIRRTLVTAIEPDLALTWGGTEGFMTRLNLEPIPEHRIRQGGRVVEIPARSAMETSFRNVHEACEWQMEHTLDQVCFDLPYEALAIWAEDNSISRNLQSRFASGDSTTDPVMSDFGLAVLPILNGQAEPTQFFVDHVLDGVCSYLFEASSVQQRRGRGGLAPWQLSRAKDMMLANLATDLSLSDIAAACGLSVAHFGRAFSQSCGTKPYKWLSARRLEKAEALLKDTELPLTSVAAECGFSDQAHLSNVFSKHFGAPPGAFRRYWKNRSHHAV